MSKLLTNNKNELETTCYLEALRLSLKNVITEPNVWDDPSKLLAESKDTTQQYLSWERKSTIHEKASQVLYLFVIYPQITWSNIFLRKNDMGNNSSIPFPICGSFVYPNLTQFIQFIHDITKNANIYIYTDNDRQCLI